MTGRCDPDPGRRGGPRPGAGRPGSLGARLVSFVAALGLVGLLAPLAACAQVLTPEQQRFHQIYKELVEIDTTDSNGDNTAAARAMQRHLEAAGFAADDLQVFEPFPRKGNLVARYRGSGARKPLLLLAHLDVVEAKREDWKTDPFRLKEDDGYFTARGASDDKSMAAAFVSIFSQLKREGFQPSRDIVLALTADEERGDVPSNGVFWLIKPSTIADGRRVRHQRRRRRPARQRQADHQPGAGRREDVHDLSPRSARRRRSLVGADGGEPGLRAEPRAGAPGRPSLRRRPERRDPAVLRPDGPLQSRPGGRRHARRRPWPAVAGGDPAAREGPALQRDPADDLRRHADRGGHADNALPQSAKATVNCRIMPSDDPGRIDAELRRLLGTRVEVKVANPPMRSPASPLREDVIGVVEALTKEMWPQAVVVPTMSTGATDSRFLRNAGIPMYGVSGIFSEPSDARAHGLDERVAIPRLYDGREFLYRLVKRLAQ